MISVVCWRWPGADGAQLFGVEYVNRLRSMLARHLHIPHQLWCVTDDTSGIDSAVRCIPGPQQFDPFRCRRRLWQYSRERLALFGSRMLCIDLDMVIVDDITPLVARPEPIVMWRVGYAGVYSGSFVLCDTGALHGAWGMSHRGFNIGERNASDQAMLNAWLKTQPPIARWTEADGFCNWFGAGYEAHEHEGIGPNNPHPPKGTRIVNLGSAEKAVMDSGAYDWVREHWR